MSAYFNYETLEEIFPITPRWERVPILEDKSEKLDLLGRGCYINWVLQNLR